MQKLTDIKKDVKVFEIKNTKAVKGGCSCGDKRPKPPVTLGMAPNCGNWDN